MAIVQILRENIDFAFFVDYLLVIDSEMKVVRFALILRNCPLAVIADLP